MSSNKRLLRPKTVAARKIPYLCELQDSLCTCLYLAKSIWQRATQKWRFLVKCTEWLLLGRCGEEVINYGSIWAFSTFFFWQTLKLFQLNIRWVCGWRRIRRKIQFVFGLQLHMADQQPADENLAPARFLSCLPGTITDSFFFFNYFCAFFLSLSLFAVPSVWGTHAKSVHSTSIPPPPLPAPPSSHLRWLSSDWPLVSSACLLNTVPTFHATWEKASCSS